MAVQPDLLPRPATAPELLLPPIVLVEDDHLCAGVIRRHLRAMKLANPVVSLGNGDEAVSLLRAMAAREKLPSLILLDLELPGQSGLDILEWLAAEPVLRHVPVVMLSGHSTVDQVTTAHRMGACGYLVKPVAREALERVLRRIRCGWAMLPPDLRT
jgi:DNA-binding response OmpR family regulator